MLGWHGVGAWALEVWVNATGKKHLDTKEHRTLVFKIAFSRKGERRNQLSEQPVAVQPVAPSEISKGRSGAPARLAFTKHTHAGRDNRAVAEPLANTKNLRCLKLSFAMNPFQFSGGPEKPIIANISGRTDHRAGAPTVLMVIVKPLLGSQPPTLIQLPALLCRCRPERVRLKT